MSHVYTECVFCSPVQPGGESEKIGVLLCVSSGSGCVSTSEEGTKICIFATKDKAPVSRYSYYMPA